MSQHVPPDDPNHFGFVYPPATEEQLHITEERLGFALPPLLHALYANVANGGFGPGLGLHGAYGGYKGSYPDDDSSLPTQKHKGPTIRYDTYHKLATETIKPGQMPRMRIPWGTSLLHTLELCDLGCCVKACIDDHERMYLQAPSADDDYYILRQLPYTFEEWLWRWVRDEDLFK
ncbi:MAG TPA: hypothetical protein VFA41_06325 [Ktedonobacteraceae bacterium]|nr:hypothetical protein [Ktedonobacteraceae bacterium]